MVKNLCLTKTSNALTQCVCSKNTVYEIYTSYALLFFHSRYEKPGSSSKEYDSCLVVVRLLYYGYESSFVLAFRHVYIGGMAKQQTHTVALLSSTL